MKTKQFRIWVYAAAMLCAGTLAGCSTEPPESPNEPDAPVTHTPSPEETTTDVPDLSTRAVLIDEQTIELTTYGSSSCPDEVIDVAPVDAATIAVQLGNATDERPCTADYAPVEHTVDIPAEVTERPITLELHWQNSSDSATIPVE